MRGGGGPSSPALDLGGRLMMDRAGLDRVGGWSRWICACRSFQNSLSMHCVKKKINALCEVFAISDSANRISSKVFVPCPRVMTDSCQNLPKINQQRPRSRTTVGKPGDARPLHTELPKQVGTALLGASTIAGG